MKKLFLLLGLLISGLGFRETQISNLKVTPISPFGKVIVEFNVDGGEVSRENLWWLTCTEVDSGKTMHAQWDTFLGIRFAVRIIGRLIRL